ncbi:hypothetical protein HZ326_21592 [Fusarium oxysporum f. sp. albedinis]|nr:hypothetical protein HZ326_21592 [Fusarium oxysporum f. sp. albedinis]
MALYPQKELQATASPFIRTISLSSIDQWSTSAPEQYKRLNLKATTGCPPELTLLRAALHHLLTARSLHGDFAAYHERFNHGDAHLVCLCGRRKAPDYIFYCRKVPPHHQIRLAPSPNAAVNLAVRKDFTKFTNLSKDSTEVLATLSSISLLYTFTSSLSSYQFSAR